MTDFLQEAYQEEIDEIFSIFVGNLLTLPYQDDAEKRFVTGMRAAQTAYQRGRELIAEYHLEITPP